MRAMSKPAVRALRRVGHAFCFAGLLLSGGCDLLTISQSGRGIRDGNDAVLRGEFQKAVEHYESALDGTLLTAEAHYRLGLVYEDKLKNEVAALHHFERYLELAPQGQFSTDVRGYVDRLRLVIVSRLAEGTVVPAREAMRLKNENLELRQENAELRDQQSKTKSTAGRSVPAVTPVPRPALTALPEAAPPVPTPSAPKSHTVVSGDTLSKISRKYYGNSGDWQKIAEANKAILPDPTKLKVGMVLTVP